MVPLGNQVCDTRPYLKFDREVIRSEFIMLSLTKPSSLPSFLEEGLHASKRLDKGEPVANIAKDMKMDRSTVHKKVKIARYLDDYPQIKSMSFNKALEFVRTIEDHPNLK